MTLYIGVDFHPHQQTVASCDTRDGEIRFLTFKHSDRSMIQSFYGGLGEAAVIGVEATGGLVWFEEMIFENGHKLMVGNPHEAESNEPAQVRQTGCGDDSGSTDAQGIS